MRQSKAEGPKWSERAGVDEYQSDMLKEAKNNELNMLKTVTTTTPTCLRFCMFSCKQVKVLKKWGGFLRWLNTKDTKKNIMELMRWILNQNNSS